MIALVDFDFDAAVFRSPFPGLVVRDRFALAKPLSGNSTAIDALLDDVVFNRIHPPFGECLVVSFRADAIGVPGETRPLVFVFVHEGNQSVQNCRCFRFDIALVKVEEHIV